MNSCCFRFENSGLFTVTYQDDVIDLAAVSAFAQELMNWSQSKLTYLSFTVSEDVAGDSTGGGNYSNLGLFASVYMRNQDDDKVCVTKIPSPNDSLFDSEQRITLAAGNEITTAYNALTGKNCVFMHGALIGTARVY